MIISSSSKRVMRYFVLFALAAPVLSACGIGGLFSEKSDINTTTKFSSSEYGVTASKRVTTSSRIPKGGGRSQVGKPYKIAGKWYTPKTEPNYDRTGVASWYGPNFHGRKTANGEIFDQYAISAAHPTLPLPSYVRVTNLANNRSIIVRVNDRGPFASNRIIDLSKRVADILGVIKKGTARVRVKYVGKAPLEGDDTRMLMASLNRTVPIERGRTNAPIRIASLPKSTPQPSTPQSMTIFQNRTNLSVSPEGFFMVNNSTNHQLSPLFYAATKMSAEQRDSLLNSAFLATENMANNSENLTAWQNRTDQQALKIKLELGTFINKENAENIAIAFALLGAVNENTVVLNGKPATQLTLTQLKSGVSRKDVIDLAQKFKLESMIIYN